MNNEVLSLIDMLYTMISEARSVPLGNDRCIVERDKLLNILDEVKSRLPTELAEAKRMTSSRDEFVGSAKKEADSIRRAAEDRARELIDDQEIVRLAKMRSAEIMAAADKRTKELYRVANAYVDDALLRTEEAVNAAAEEIRQTRARFRTTAGLDQNQAQAQGQMQDEQTQQLQQPQQGGSFGEAAYPPPNGAFGEAAYARQNRNFGEAAYPQQNGFFQQ